MNVVVILILAIVWAVFLIPQLVRARAEHSAGDSIGSFRRHLHTLERTSPYSERGAVGPTAWGPSGVATQYGTLVHPAGAPITRWEARKRRRDILCGLLAAMLGSLLLGLIPALRVMWALHLVLDVLFVAYVVMLVQIRNAAARQTTVRFLPARPAPEPALLLRRSAN